MRVLDCPEVTPCGWQDVRLRLLTTYPMFSLSSCLEAFPVVHDACVCVCVHACVHICVCLCVCVCVWPAGDDLLLLLSGQLDWKVSDFLVFITQNGIGVDFFLYHLFIRQASKWRPAWCWICLWNVWFCNPTPLSQEVILAKTTVMCGIWVDLFGFFGGGLQARFCTYTWRRLRSKLKGMVYNHVDWKFHFVILLQGHGTLWCAPRYFSAPPCHPKCMVIMISSGMWTVCTVYWKDSGISYPLWRPAF